MSNNDTAYRTADPAVLAEFQAWVDGQEETRVKRNALIESVGRNLYINRGNGYGSTRVTGFERFDSDKDGDLVHHDGCLIVSSKRGQHDGMVVPNLKRKQGKEFAEELKTYTSPGLTLTGMPTFHVYGTDMGLMMGGPTITLWGGVLYAFWHCDSAPVEDNWEKIPLSTYHLAREQHEENTDD